jgi:hypothetical protein
MEHHWEYYKDIMQQHFLTEDKTLTEVMKFMNDTYNFRARYSPFSGLSKWPHIAEFVDSKAQYERQFNKWKFRKHCKHPDWKFVHYRIEKRKRGDKESDLYIDGVLIPKKKIRKETSRHNLPTIQEYYGQGSICPKLWYCLEYLNSSSTQSKNTGRILYLHSPSSFGQQLSVKQSSLVPVPDHD